MYLDPPSDTGGSEITAHILEADDGKGTGLIHLQNLTYQCKQGLMALTIVNGFHNKADWFSLEYIK